MSLSLYTNTSFWEVGDSKSLLSTLRSMCHTNQLNVFCTNRMMVRVAYITATARTSEISPTPLITDRLLFKRSNAALYSKSFRLKVMNSGVVLKFFGKIEALSLSYLSWRQFPQNSRLQRFPVISISTIYSSHATPIYALVTWFSRKKHFFREKSLSQTIQ